MELRDRFKGCLVGLATGDAIGSPFEFWLDKKVVEYLEKNELEMSTSQRGDIKYPIGFYTDDTSLALCLASSLIEKGFSLSDQFERYCKWLNEGYMTPLGVAYGVGQQTFRALNRDLRTDNLLDGSSENEGGNGSLMRCAPIGLYYQGNLDKIKEKSLLSSYITHNSLVAGWTCVVLNSIISLIIDGKKKDEILSFILEYFEEEMPVEIIRCLTFDYKSLGDKYLLPISGYSLDTLGIALWSWQTSENFEESIRKVVMLGNDTDTFGAVTGAITGCYYGFDEIPDKWKGKVMKVDDITKIAETIFEKRNSK